VTVLFVILPASLVFAVVAFLVYRWAVRSGQFDDLETPAHRILHDEEDGPAPPSAQDTGASTES